MELAENTAEHETGELQMLEASQQEIRKAVSEDARGLSRPRQGISVFLYCYVYEPIATGFRFLHLTIIFLPVLVSVPVMWIGRRNPDRNNQRWGTLWWFDLLVKSMERAGPAFIKVYPFLLLPECQLLFLFFLFH
jgi:aarF domain-containing kinase